MTRCLPTACVVLLSLLAAGCSSGSGTATVGDTTVSAAASGGSLSAPGLSVGGGVGVVTIETAEDPAQGLYGPWTLARSGDRVCTIDLGSKNAAGDYTAKTRRCASVDLARIAIWTPTPDGLVLYDFERRPVVAFRQSAPDLFEGLLAGEIRVTLWR